MEIKTNYYEEIFDSFRRQCPGWANEVVSYRPKNLHAIRITLDDGELLDYNIQTRAYRFVSERNVNSDNEITDHDCRDAFASNLAEIMTMRGYGQSILAEKTGLSPAIISKYLNRKSTPTITNLRKIARALNCLPEELLE